MNKPAGKASRTPKKWQERRFHAFPPHYKRLEPLV